MTSNWETVLLGDVFQPSTTRLGEHEDEPPVFAISKYDGVVLSSDYHDRRVASANLDTYKIVGVNDWAYSTIHIDEGSIARNRHGFQGVVSPMYTIMRWISVDHEPAYFELLLKSPQMLAAYGAFAQGSINRRKSLPWKTFSNLQISAPSLTDQRRIVDLIGALDNAIEAADGEALAADRLWWEITKDLEKSSSALAMVPLGDISDISGGLTKNKKDSAQPDVVEVPYLRVANVHRRYLNLSDVALIKTTQSKADKLRLLPGDIVMNEGGDKDKLGRGAIWRGEIDGCIHQNHVFRVRVTAPEFSPEFVSNWSNSFGQRWFETFGTQTTGIASISKTTLSKFPVPVISMSEQREWVTLLESALSVYDEASAHADSLRKLRAELLTSLLSGAHAIPEAYDDIMTMNEAAPAVSVPV